MSTLVARAWWRLLRGPARRSTTAASFTGPVIVVTSIFAWLASAALGWALVYTPAMQQAEAFAGHGDGSAFIASLYLSLVTISTLGFGDVVPSADWARLLVPLEALFGLGVAAGTIGWLANLQPVLSHRSALAAKVALVEQAEQSVGVDLHDEPGLQHVVHELTLHLASVHTDLVHFPLSYYFFAGEQYRPLPDQVQALQRLGERCAGSHDRSVRFQGAMLLRQVDVVTREVARRHLRVGPGAGVAEVLDAWRVDHTEKRRAPT